MYIPPIWAMFDVPKKLDLFLFVRGCASEDLNPEIESNDFIFEFHMDFVLDANVEVLPKMRTKFRRGGEVKGHLKLFKKSICFGKAGLP